MSKYNHVSIIIPVLNEGQLLIKLLESIQCWRQFGHEIILVDGGGDNNTVLPGSIRSIAPLVDLQLKTPAGRALQMNEGAKYARHDILFFLHADSELDDNSIFRITQALELDKSIWGRFDIKLSGAHWMLRIIEKMMNIRSRITGVATGDQGIFVYREIFNKINGYANIALMEDVEISKRLNRISRPVCLATHITTSSRKWEKKGIVKTVMLMWLLRMAYFVGISPGRLGSIYYSL